ncbi:hypothetical protein GN956_G21673 [Arapaima gigas]
MAGLKCGAAENRSTIDADVSTEDRSRTAPWFWAPDPGRVWIRILGLAPGDVSTAGPWSQSWRFTPVCCRRKHTTSLRAPQLYRITKMTREIPASLTRAEGEINGSPVAEPETA